MRQKGPLIVIFYLVICYVFAEYIFDLRNTVSFIFIIRKTLYCIYMKTALRYEQFDMRAWFQNSLQDSTI